jgi:hypothetical protein
VLEALTGLLFLFLHRFRLARFSRSRFVPPRHYSSAGLFACAGFGFARSGFSTETAKSLRRTIYFLIHDTNIRNRLRICKKKVKLFLPQKKPCIPPLAGIRSKHLGNFGCLSAGRGAPDKHHASRFSFGAPCVGSRGALSVYFHKCIKNPVTTLKAFAGKVLRLQRS